jgi:hypothetical protein
MYEISAPITTINVSIYNVFVFTVPQYFNWNGRGRGDGGRVRATMKPCAGYLGYPFQK